MPSLSRTLAAWAVDLRYEDLPDAVLDRARGVTLHALASALLGHDKPEVRQALAMMLEDNDGSSGPAQVLVHGARLGRGDAAFVNSEMIFAGGKWDTFRMLTHPGCAILPAALAATSSGTLSGRAFITALVAGYEVMERMAADFIPTVMARGFHAGPVFAIFGAAVTAAKLAGLDAEQMHGAIAQCVNLAGGNLEGARSGGRGLREGAAVRNALLAVAMARQGVPGGETVLEGAAGFYHAYAGDHTGRLRYSFTGDNTAPLDAITAGLGSDWRFLETLYRIYSTAGYNIAHVDVTARLCEDHGVVAADIATIQATVNWLETEYPSPAFPSRERGPAVGSPHYYAAYGAVCRRFPLLKDVVRGIGPADPPEVLDLMRRVTIVPAHRHGLFAPRITVHLRDGTSISRTATGREFMWDFEEEARRLQEIVPGIPIAAERFAALVQACRTLDEQDDTQALVAATLV